MKEIMQNAMLKKEDQLSKYKQHLQGIYASRAVADI